MFIYEIYNLLRCSAKLWTMLGITMDNAGYYCLDDSSHHPFLRRQFRYVPSVPPASWPLKSQCHDVQFATRTPCERRLAPAVMFQQNESCTQTSDVIQTINVVSRHVQTSVATKT